MILLILAPSGPYETVYDLFKFHYDSINSYKKCRACDGGIEFKFHYDSINSRSFLV